MKDSFKEFSDVKDKGRKKLKILDEDMEDFSITDDIVGELVITGAQLDHIVNLSGKIFVKKVFKKIWKWLLIINVLLGLFSSILCVLIYYKVIN